MRCATLLLICSAATIAAAADKPKPKPAPKKQPTRWHNAKPHEWALYKFRDHKTLQVRHYFLAAQGKDVIGLKLYLWQHGKRVWAREQLLRMPRTATAAEAAKYVRKTKDLGVKTFYITGRAIQARGKEITLKVGQKTFTKRIWLSPRVPGQLVREMSDAGGKMRLMLDLVNFKRRIR